MNERAADSAGRGRLGGVGPPGLIRPRPDSLAPFLRSESIREVYFVEQTPFARGKFASVRKVRHLVTGVEYAAKFIRKRRRAIDTTHEIYHEVAVLAICGGSSRLVCLHEVYETSSEIVLVLELAAGGELQRIFDNEDLLLEKDAQFFMQQILEGLAHLHSHNVAHLDLKPQNLLLTTDFPHGEIKLCDFGISRLIEPGVEVREIVGTPDYVAPEILSYEPISLAADIWSIGVLAYVLLSGGYSPFSGNTKQETFLNISQCALSFPDEEFSNVSVDAIDFIKSTLVIDPKKRLTVQQCLNHSWFNKMSFEAVLSLTPENCTKLCSDKIIDLNPVHENIQDSPILSSSSSQLKHHHSQESSLSSDELSTPKMSKKSYSCSPTVILNNCTFYHNDSPPSNDDTVDKCKSNDLFTNVLKICTFKTSSNVHGNTKENSPLHEKKDTEKSCISYDSDRVKMSSDSYAEYIQCEVQCCM